MPTESGAGWWAMYSEPSGVENPPQHSRRIPVDFFVVNGTDRTPWVVPIGGGDPVPAEQIGVTDWAFEEVLNDPDFIECTDQNHTSGEWGPPILDPDGWDRVCGGIRA
jgi:hypothetical protein